MPKTLPDVAKLRDEIQALPEPKDYYHGVRLADATGLPENILLFARSDARALTKPAQRARQDHHHRFVLIVVLEGSGTVCVDHRLLPGRPGEALLVHPHQFHHYPRIDEERVRWLFVTFESAPGRPWQSWRGQWTRVPPETWIALRQAVRAWNTMAPASDVVLPIALALHQLTRAPAVRRNARARPTAPGGALARVNARLAAASPETPPDIETLARQIGLSASHLRRVFRDETSMSLGRYLFERRVARAIAVLRTPGSRVSDAANAGGFASIYAFSRAFRRFTGMAPSEYRRR